MTNTNEWRMNDGTVPEGVGPDTPIEIEYADGLRDVWNGDDGDCKEVWMFEGTNWDIIRWRFV